MNRTMLLCFATAIIAAAASSQDHPRAAIELVESVPVETVLDNPEIRNTAEVWSEMILSARRSLEIEQFYISDEPGEPLEAILAEVLAAGERGVAVRIIVDSRMHRTYPESVARLAKGRNIAARVIDFSRLAGGIQHAKFFIVDGEEIFLGSQNFDWRALKHIHELGLRMRHGGLVAAYRDIFDLDWRLADDPAAARTAASYAAPFAVAGPGGENITLRPTASPLSLLPDTSMWDEPNIVRLIDSARSEIFCQFLSYSPVGRDKSLYTALENALKRAALRGVKVSMIVSDWEKDHPSVDHIKSLSCFPNIRIKFSEIPQASTGYVSFARVEHCKFIVADADAFWLGTSNAEKSYFYTSRNLGVIVRSASLASQVRGVFLRSWDGPYTSAVRTELEYSPREHGER